MNSQTIDTIREALTIRYNDLDDIIRHGVYAEPEGIQETLVAIDAALDELEVLERTGVWTPVEDDVLEYPNWDGNGTVFIRVLNDGAELEQWHSSLPDNIDEISLSLDYRLCRLTTAQE